eukprot:Opistho-2@14838
MIRDTSAQDRPLAAAPTHRRRLLLGALALFLLGLLAWNWSSLQRLLGSGASVSIERLNIATVERGALLRDIAGEGKVVAATSPTLYAAHGGTVTHVLCVDT